jgi:hypothetical protein
MVVHGEKARCEGRARESFAFSEAWETNSRNRDTSVRGALIVQRAPCIIVAVTPGQNNVTAAHPLRKILGLGWVARLVWPS